MAAFKMDSYRIDIGKFGLDSIKQERKKLKNKEK